MDNERQALRRFSDVYGAVVVAPTTHLEPGVVEAAGAKLSGFLDLGRYPSGPDARSDALAATLSGARFRSRSVPDVMRLKYGKLLLNLGNAVGALFAADAARDTLAGAVRREGIRVLDAAAVEHSDADSEVDRDALGVAPIAGRSRSGSSTWQSLARGTGIVETDYLNGEISLLGRLSGTPTPLNDAVCRVAEAHARRGGRPGELAAEGLLAEVAA